MTSSNPYKPNPELDLVLERVVDVPPDLVWQAWTRPEYLKQWWTPAPWQTADAEIDLRPGGIFRTVYRSPEGEESTNLGCYLEIVPGKKLIWTDALGPGYRPKEKSTIPEMGFFTAIISMEPEGKGTRYKAIAIHKDPAAKETHEKMGFLEGWGTVLDQLVALMKKQMA
jgi:uncharacterized protein YndB with AHSA1/START domain